MRDIEPEIRARGARLIVVGSGTPAHARAFAEEEKGLPFELYVDPELGAYQAAGMRKGIAAGSISAGFRAMAKGYFPSATPRGDATQNGGVYVFAPDGQTLYRQISGFSGDHADPAEILAALPEPAERAVTEEAA